MISKDNNTTHQIIARFMKKKNLGHLDMFINTLLDLLANLWYYLLLNFSIVFFNYLAPLVMVMVQVWGIYNQSLQ